ncbi:MAG: hypothetical protein ACQCXQ_15495 [Verrucomicrobiales bacterium]|nr:hypothetical protein [Verrucomicrobiota bacterium JB025]
MKFLIISAFAIATINARAALTINLPGTSEQELWDNLNSSTYNSTNGFTGSYGNPTADWSAAIAGSTGNATFDKTSGGGYFSGSSLYNAGIPGSFSISSTSVLPAIATLVFQIDAASAAAIGADPVLTINGTTTVAAAFSAENDGDFLTYNYTTGTFSPTANLAWQWDLSGETVTSWEITFSTTPHASIYELAVDSGDSFAQAVPEPSAVIVSTLSAALLLRRRRN